MTFFEAITEPDTLKDQIFLPFCYRPEETPVASCVLQRRAADTEIMEPQEKVKPLLLQRETLFGNFLRLAVIVSESGSFVFSALTKM